MDVLNRAAIKAEARNFIGQDTRWLKLFLPCLPLLLLSGQISYGITLWRTVSENGGYNEVRYQTGGGIASLLLLPLMVAIAGFFLNHIRGFHPEWKTLYQEGFNRYGKYFAVGFITKLFIGLWTLLLIVPGIIKALEYSQVNYLIHDNPNLTPSQARDISRRMTEGFKSELLIMQLSFVLWYMLAGVTAGLAMFYVYPYVATTEAMYYENLKTYAMTANRVTPAEFGIASVPPYGNVQQPFSSEQPPLYTGMQGANPYDASVQPNTPHTAASNDFTPPAAEDTFCPGSAVCPQKPTPNGFSADTEEWKF